MLDVGCGCGATTLAAARAVKPGRVTGVDLSAPMLELARQRGRDEPVEFVQGDAQTDSFEATAYDAVISRFGTMFFDDPITAFANLASATRSGGRLCLATWQPLTANDWLIVPGAALLRYGPLPDTGDGGPGMFAQADPTTVHDVLTSAGWQDISVDLVTVSMRLGADPADATDYLADTGIARAVLDTIDASFRAEAIAAVAEALEDHASDEGVILGAGINLISARR